MVLAILKLAYWRLRQNLPSNLVGFHATAACEHLTCALTHFLTNLLPDAVVASAVAIFLKALMPYVYIGLHKDDDDFYPRPSMDAMLFDRMASYLQH